MLSPIAPRAGLAPSPGLHHASTGLDAAMSRRAERRQAEAPDDPAVAAFAEMVAAIKSRDFRAATRHRRELNGLGFNVLVRPAAVGARP